jgi:hypothetical protein
LGISIEVTYFKHFVIFTSYLVQKNQFPANSISLGFQF